METDLILRVEGTHLRSHGRARWSRARRRRARTCVRVWWSGFGVQGLGFQGVGFRGSGFGARLRV